MWEQFDYALGLQTNITQVYAVAVPSLDLFEKKSLKTLLKRMVRLKYPIILILKLDSGQRVCPDNIFSYKNIF